VIGHRREKVPKAKGVNSREGEWNYKRQNPRRIAKNGKSSRPLESQRITEQPLAGGKNDITLEMEITQMARGKGAPSKKTYTTRQPPRKPDNSRTTSPRNTSTMKEGGKRVKSGTRRKSPVIGLISITDQDIEVQKNLT